MKKSYTFTWIGIVICLLGLSPVSYAQAIEITDSAPFLKILTKSPRPKKILD